VTNEALAPASLSTREAASDPALGWAGKQGADYAIRNPADAAFTDYSYEKRFGVTRTKVNDWTLQGVPRDATVLEVGCSHGAMLNGLAVIGFTNLEGCDISADALKQCPWPNKLADGRALPYDSESFDMVMTSGTLMQIPPGAKAQFMAECYRVAKRWVYGVEGASLELRQWDFGALIPPAWTDLYPDSILVPGWKIVRAQWLAPLNSTGAGKMSLRAYLLERG
jgi:hypothetical protein